MARSQRPQYAPSFTEQSGDFNEQLYVALKKSPWWMISIAAHVLLFVVSSLFRTEVVLAAAPPQMQTNLGDVEVPPEDPPGPEIDEIEQLQSNELVAEEPVIKDTPIADHTETDNDLPTDTAYGDDGSSDAPFTGFLTNDAIGLAGGSGSPFGDRGGGNENLRKGGPRPGGKVAHDAIEDALKWLAAHQSPDGGWESEGFARHCDGKIISGEGPDGRGKAQYDVGVTGMSLLAFLGAGYTNRSSGPFGKVVGNGLKYLRNVQDAEGAFGSRSSGHFVYNHSIAALAMVEAYGMTGSPIYRGPTQKALDFIAISRNPYFAWRYGVKPGDNDTSVTGWMMMALKSAKLINQADVKANKPPSLTIDEDAFDGIRAWVDKMTDPDYGRVGYQQRGSGPARPNDLVDRFPADKSESMTAVGMLARVFLGENPKTSDAIQKGAELCSKLVPTWNEQDGSIDMYYWYYATLAMFQVGGEPWKRWEAAMKPAIIDTQRKDTDFCMYKGSWDPKDPWGPDGGRVYSTACLCMCLEVWFRYEKVFGTR